MREPDYFDPSEPDRCVGCGADVVDLNDGAAQDALGRWRCADCQLCARCGDEPARAGDICANCKREATDESETTGYAS